MILADSPWMILIGTAVQTASLGAGRVTETVTVAVSELVAFFAVKVYDVVFAGDTLTEPAEAFTAPGVGVIVAESALRIFHESVVAWPP